MNNTTQKSFGNKTTPWLVFFVSCLVALAACEEEVPVLVEPEPETRSEHTMVVLNLASSDESCSTTGGGICSIGDETAVADRLAELKPDLIVLTRVADLEDCETPEPSQICGNTTHQADRLVPAGYVVACQDNGGVCIAAAENLELAGCSEGFCPGKIQSAPTVTECDLAYGMGSAKALLLDGTTIQIVGLDLPVQESAASNPGQEQCRFAMYTHLFEHTGQPASFLPNKPALAVGTAGIDPYNPDKTATDDQIQWASNVSNFDSATQTLFHYLSAVNTGQATAPRTYLDPQIPLAMARVDHAIAHTATGHCDLLDGSSDSIADIPGGNASIGDTDRMLHAAHYCVFSTGTTDTSQ